MSRVARLRLQPPRAVIRRAAGHPPPGPPAPKLIRVAPRSVAADATPPAVVAAIHGADGPLAVVGDAPLEPPRELGPIRTLRRRLAALAAAALVVAVVALAVGGTRVVLAVFTDQADVGATFTTGTWGEPTTWYLHNDPTPPTGTTLAQALLAMDETAPSGATLYNYGSDCDGRPGREIQRGSGLVTETVTCRFATWRSAALPAARTLDGTATLSAWARKTASGGTNPTLRAFLRVLDPVSGMYTELGSSDAAVSRNANQSWGTLELSWALTGVSVPAGSVVEVKVVATGGTRDPEIAYDTTGQPSALTLP